MSSIESTTVSDFAVSVTIPGESSSTHAQNTGDIQDDATDLIEDDILPRLDPSFVQYHTDVLSKKPRSHEVSLAETRGHPDLYRPTGSLDTSGYDRVVDHEVTSADGIKIPVRVYYPEPKDFGNGPYPAHLNFHGGGFVLGDLSTDGQICLSMRDAGIVVVDVGYRHCPETIWGKCIEDGWAALNWTREPASALNINATSISIGGISAGGHISLVLQHMARDSGIPLRLCMASVPPSADVLTYKSYTDSSFSSFHEFHRAPVLPWRRIQYFGNLCMPQQRLPKLRAMWPDWWFAPIRSPNWTGLCDTFIRTAEIDPLRDEAEAYGAKLVAGGNKVTVKRYLRCPHIFMHIQVMKQKVEYDVDAIIALKAAHGVSELVPGDGKT
ncbi:Alpha/Beta hydrolase protein [Podospora appendiculata]|uniref:Alpha/Beta hydrolase protein n=1 Tax=Podospora appendiculata TaxID=314037 RepID=A0AAE0X250_9PEZI|nr:Alpha/Beta hydrolase protein [Podospora appendiculata]